VRDETPGAMVILESTWASKQPEWISSATNSAYEHSVCDYRSDTHKDLSERSPNAGLWFVVAELSDPMYGKQSSNSGLFFRILTRAFTSKERSSRTPPARPNSGPRLSSRVFGFFHHDDCRGPRRSSAFTPSSAPFAPLHTYETWLSWSVPPCASSFARRRTSTPRPPRATPKPGPRRCVSSG